jgi:hypothetical protein
MRPLTVWLTAFAALAESAASAGELTELPPAIGAGVERGVALLRCVDPHSELLRQSRAIVLDAGVAHADVLLTTAHGLAGSAENAERECLVLARGKQHAIEAVWLAGDYASGPEHDWAVVLLAKRIEGDVRRWRAVEAVTGTLEGLVEGRAPVRLVLRYAGTAQTDCRLERWTAQRLLAHTCLTYPGESGSPLVAGMDQTLVLIGVHIGSQLEWNGTTIDMISVARPLDATIIAAVETAALRAAADAPRRRR